MVFVPGKWKAACDRCSSEYLNHQLRMEWNGLRVCYGPGTNDCWEPRHPLDKLKGRKDKQATAWTSPEPPDIDVSPGSGNEVSASDL